MEKTPEIEIIQEIIKRLNIISVSQKLVEQASEGYKGWYENESDEMPYSPEEVKLEFWKQYFCFSHSILHDPYIGTSFKIIVANGVFGFYHLFTHLDGTVVDDSLGWGEPHFHALPKDKGFRQIEGEALRFETVPEDMQELVQNLLSVSRQRKLTKQTLQQCIEWFQRHLTWYQRYPQSLADRNEQKSHSWFQYHPNWYQEYPKNIPFKNYDVSTTFDRQGICFNHADIPYPYMFTTLNVYAGEYEIGSYCLVTQIDGSMDKELSGVLPIPFDPVP